MSEETKEPTNAEAESAEVVQPQSLDDLERGMKLKGTVVRLELYGAFIDVGLETTALVHISKLGSGRVNRVSDAVSIGDEVEVWVENVNPGQRQIMVSMVEPVAVDWSDLQEGQVYTGEVKRLESYGAFVDIGAEREGLVHISELSHDYVKSPSEVVHVGDELQVQVIGYNRRKRRIDLSIKALQEKPESESVASSDEVADFGEQEEDLPTAMEIAMRRAMSKEGNGEDTKSGKQHKKKRGQDDILSRTLKLSD